MKKKKKAPDVFLPHGRESKSVPLSDLARHIATEAPTDSKAAVTIKKRRRTPAVQTRPMEDGEREFHARVRRHVIEEFKAGKRIERELVEARKVVPLNLLLATDIEQCRLRMKKAVVDVVVRLQQEAKRKALRKWRRFVIHAERQERLEQERLESRLKQAKSIKFLNKMAKRAIQGKPKVFFLHWSRVTLEAREKLRLESVQSIQRIARGFLGRLHAKCARERLVKYQKSMLRDVRTLAFLEAKARVWKRYRGEMESVRQKTHLAASRIQNVFRKYKAQRHVHVLKKKRFVNLKREFAATNIQAWARTVLVRRRVHKKLQFRRRKAFKLRDKMRERNAASVMIQRYLRGLKARRSVKRLKFERDSQEWAARKMQKAWRVSQGSYALSIKIAARREKDKQLASERRGAAATRVQTAFRGYQAKCRLMDLKARQAILEQRRNRAAQRIQIFWWNAQGKVEMAMRCAAQRYDAERKLKAAIKIQSTFRGYRWRKFVFLKRQRLQAARVIQRSIRAAIARRRLFRLRLERQLLLNRSATTIQCMFRQWKARQVVHCQRRLLASIKLQCWSRCLKALWRYRKERAAQTIQCWRRCVLAQRITNRLRCIVRIQSWRRSLVSQWELARLKKDYEEIIARRQLERNSAIRIQRHTRGFFARKLVWGMRRERATRVLQTFAIRPFLARTRFKKRKQRKDLEQSRLISKTRWAVLTRQKGAQTIQCSFRCYIARQRVKAARKAYREAAACIIQRQVRVLIARLTMKRAREERAARRIQTFFRRDIVEYNVLVAKFKARRELMDRQLHSALAMQRLWRASRGRKRFRKMIQKERNRVIKAEYVLERKNKAAAEQKRLERKEFLQDRRRKARLKIREHMEKTVVEEADEEKKEKAFKKPGWASNLPALDVLERILAHHGLEEMTKQAWRAIPAGDGQVYFYNSLTNQSQWEEPPHLLEEREQELAAMSRHDLESQLIHQECRKENVKPFTKLRCKNRISWVSTFAVCNSPAVEYCASCNQVFCSRCSQSKHKKGVPRNHKRINLTQTDNRVCSECQEQLGNKSCKQCEDCFCTHCWKVTHGSGALAGHECEEISRFDFKPVLEYGDQVCPNCEMVAATRKCKHCVDVFCDACYDSFHSKGRRGEHEWTPANEYAVWKKLFDVAANRYYYLNTFTKERLWTKPEVLEEKEMNEHRQDAKPVEGRNDDGTLDLRSENEKQIAEMKDRVEALQAWKQDFEEQEAQQDREREEKEALEPPKTTWARFRSSPMTFLAHPFSTPKNMKDIIYAEQKEFLEKTLRRESIEEVNVGAVYGHDDLSRKAYRDLMLQQMARGRREMREGLHREAQSHLSTEEFKRRVRKLERDFKGVENSKALVHECELANIPYGPRVTGPEKLNKAQAIEALVLHRHRMDVEKQRKLEEEQEQLKSAQDFRKRLAQMEEKHKLRLKQ